MAVLTGTWIGTAQGTFGELLQGVLPPYGRDFLVTLPIARGSTAAFRWDPIAPLHVTPSGKVKSQKLARRMLEIHRIPVSGSLRLSSELPEGKGLASSTADLVATARAVAAFLGITLTPAAIAELLRDIEPSDGIMYNGVTAFYHREVRLHSKLGYAPPLTIIGLEGAGSVDTIAFNEIPKCYTSAEIGEYSHLLELLAAAIRRGDPRVIGRVATRSALLNQRLHPKELLPDLVAISEAHQCLGVIAAHSGTALGILIPGDAPGHVVSEVLSQCRKVSGAVTVDHALTAPALVSARRP